MKPRTAADVVSPYLDSAGAIVYLRLGSRSGLQRLIDNWGLPVLRRGGRLLFDTRELDAWVRGHDSALELARAARRTA